MPKAPRNRTITLSKNERISLGDGIIEVTKPVTPKEIENNVILGDFTQVAEYLPSEFIDLLFVDPPYNLTKKFKSRTFKKKSLGEYTEWMDSWLGPIIRLLKPTASIYICGDWRSSAAIHKLCEKYFVVRNRITFEREKGRGSKSNWKNNSEDIWFCTMGDDYYFDADAVKLKKQVVAPYKKNGKPKDWLDTEAGKFRMTYPSNIWTDITVPFWSMHENTPHPTQKPEKLLAKIILASSKKGDTIFDPFAGVGTAGVTAKKLGRDFVMVEIEKEYCLYAQKRLKKADEDRNIQGYVDGIFFERNAGT